MNRPNLHSRLIPMMPFNLNHQQNNAQHCPTCLAKTCLMIQKITTSQENNNENQYFEEKSYIWFHVIQL